MLVLKALNSVLQCMPGTHHYQYGLSASFPPIMPGSASKVVKTALVKTGLSLTGVLSDIPVEYINPSK